MPAAEALVNRRTLGILATVVGSAVGAWWWSQLRARARVAAPVYDRGTVIFDNTPTASDTDII